MMPLITRRSSTRGSPRARGKTRDDYRRNLNDGYQDDRMKEERSGTFDPLAVMPGLVVQGNRQVTFRYRNWRGETAQRSVRVLSVWFGSTRWRPKRQWFMRALDLEDMATRDFAMKDMSDVSDVY
jgi:predicted DNA-binding transcriptional regulator YafY